MKIILYRPTRSRQYKLLFNVAANVNHEVSSPLMVIKSINGDLRYERDELIKEISPNLKCTCGGKNDDRCGVVIEDINVEALVGKLRNYITSIDELIELGETAVDQIYDSLNSLSDYKTVKFSNGNMNIYMLMDISVKMLLRTNTNKFNEIIIDSELKKYSVYHDNGMTNSFFLNTIINHIKNSLEAKANKIEFKLSSITDKKLDILIIDNSSGVPEDIIESIYDLNKTTKSNIPGERGTGLHTNKLLLTEVYDGDTVFVSTIPWKQTIFKVTILIEDYKYEEIK